MPNLRERLREIIARSAAKSKRRKGSLAGYTPANIGPVSEHPVTYVRRGNCVIVGIGNRPLHPDFLRTPVPRRRAPEEP